MITSINISSTLGSVVLQQFHQVLLVFAAVLFVSAFKIITSNDDDDEDDDLSNNAIINFAKRFLKVLLSLALSLPSPSSLPH